MQGFYILKVQGRWGREQTYEFADKHDCEEAAEDWLCDKPFVEIILPDGDSLRITQEQSKRDRGIYLY